MPSVALVTLADPQADLEAVAAAGLSWDEAWAHAPSVRPALASLLTGYLPTTHGVRDPVRHGVAAPTLAELLDHEGWTVRAASTRAPHPLHPGETWGFERVDLPEALWSAPDPALLWADGDAELLDRALRWQAAAPHRHLAVTGVARGAATLEGDGGRVPLIWVGEGFPAGLTDGDPVGQIDLAATVLEVTGLPTDAVDGVDLRAGGSARIVQEDARPTLAFGQPGVRRIRGVGATGRIIGLEPAPVFDLAPAPSTVRAWRAEGALPTDPLGTEKVFAHDAQIDLEAAAEAGRLVRVGRLAVAREALDALEARVGHTPATASLRADLLRRHGRPAEALDVLEALWATHPSPGLALRVGYGHLDARDPAAAQPWFERALAAWPDQPDALVGQIRAALLRAEDALAQDAWARLAVVDPVQAERVALFVDLGEGLPVAPAAMEQACAPWPDDPWCALLRARALWAAGRLEAALEQAEHGLARWPGDVGLRLELGSWWIELGDGDRAVRLLGPVVRRFPEDLRVATLYAAAHDTVAAERLRTQALRALWRQRGD